eukprot:5749272-Amphidinium_carterae.1
MLPHDVFTLIGASHHRVIINMDREAGVRDPMLNRPNQSEKFCFIHRVGGKMPVRQNPPCFKSRLKLDDRPSSAAENAIGRIRG